MKQLLLIIFSLCFALILNAQTPQKTGSDPQNMKVMTDQEPFYPKGEQVLYNEVLMNVKYPAEAIKKYVEGSVTLSFDVKTDSVVTNIMVISGVGSGVDEAVKEYVSRLKFAPGVQNGMKIKMNTMYTFPVKAH